MKKDEDILTTEKECIEYTIRMFASDPSGFISDDKDSPEVIERKIIEQYNKFKELSKKHKINFKETVCSWSRGEKLFKILG